MKLKITFYPDGQWEGGGMFPSRLQNFSRLAEWIRRFLKEITDIGENYKIALLNDGVVLGQEKANLIKEIDDVISGLLLFRQYLTEESQKQVAADDGRGFKYNIRLLDNLWTGNGELSFDAELEKLSFADLHNEIIPKKIKIIFARYGTAVGDGRISGEERRELHARIDQLLGGLFRIERRLQRD